MIDEKKLTRYIKTEINPYGKPFDGTVFEFGNMIMDYIERMEKELERKWIPVSERLPEKDGYYFVTKRLIDGRIQTDIEPFWTGADRWKSEFHFAGIGLWEVLAWQPLPEPYKAGEHHD